MNVVNVPIFDMNYSCTVPVFMLSFFNIRIEDLHSDDISKVLRRKGISPYRYSTMMFTAHYSDKSYIEGALTRRIYGKKSFEHFITPGG